MLLTHTAVPWC